MPSVLLWSCLLVVCALSFEIRICLPTVFEDNASRESCQTRLTQDASLTDLCRDAAHDAPCVNPTHKATCCFSTGTVKVLQHSRASSVQQSLRLLRELTPPADPHTCPATPLLLHCHSHTHTHTHHAHSSNFHSSNACTPPPPTHTQAHRHTRVCLCVWIRISDVNQDL